MVTYGFIWRKVTIIWWILLEQSLFSFCILVLILLYSYSLSKYTYFSYNGIYKEREARTACRMFLVIFGYIFCVMPITVMHLFHDSGISDYTIDSYIHFGALCLSRLQYSMNFFIYCARNEQYQNAYKFFFKKVWWILYIFKKIKILLFLSQHRYST